MEKRYQVFVSSTYTDLQTERQKVIQTLMEMDCIPSGMELFPAIDEEQLLFIKKIIDDCDYYIIIVSGRYGSIADDGFSYTEKEYDYAIQKGLKVIALLHGEPEKIINSKSENNPELTQKLKMFIDKIKNGRLVKTWTSEKDLPGIVALSMLKTIKTYPAIGWVRANSIGTAELLSEINELRKENEILRNTIENEKNIEEIIPLQLADFDDFFTIRANKTVTRASLSTIEEFKATWKEIFNYIAPYLIENPNDNNMKQLLNQFTLDKLGNCRCYSLHIMDQDFQTIKIQLQAYGLLNIKYLNCTNGTMALFWILTKSGNAKMVELRTIKNNKEHISDSI